MAMEQLSGYIVLTGVAEEEDGLFVSLCQELGTSSCGDTAVEALENLGEAIEVHLNALTEVGEIARFLAERGVKVVDGDPHDKNVHIQVPLGSTVKTYSHELSGIEPHTHSFE